MNAIGKAFIAAVAQGKVPAGARETSVNTNDVAESFLSLQKEVAHIRSLDNGPSDLNPEKGQVSLDYADRQSRGLPAHRFDASFEGSLESGTTLTTRTIPVGNRTVVETSWNRIENFVRTSVDFSENDDKVIVAPSLIVSDTNVAENSQAWIWSPYNTADSLGLIVDN